MLWDAYERVCWAGLDFVMKNTEEIVTGGRVDWKALGLVPDKNSRHFPLLDTPWITITCIILYQTLIPVGQVIMRNRVSWNINAFMAVYNLALVALSAYMCIECCIVALQSNYSLACQRVLDTDSPLGLRMANVLWWYYISKLFEFMDTIAMVLRKKNNQVTFLHKYHHGSMFLLWWIQVRHTPGGQATVGVVLNSFVHVIMYAYYFSSLTGIGSSVSRRVKPHITQLQLLQFVLIFAHAVSGYYFDCGYPRAALVLLLMYLVTMITLFTNFYIKTYLKKRAGASSRKEN